MKILGRIVVVLVSLLVVAGVIVYFTVDGILKRTIEKNGTTSLKLTTTLNSAHLSLLGGKVKLNKLGIASPAGFSAPRMLEIHDIKLAVSDGELRKDPIHVESLVLNQPMIVISALAAKAAESGSLPPQLKALLQFNAGQVAGKLGAEAQKQISAALPGELGKKLSTIDTQSVVKDPGKALQGDLGGILGGKKK